MRPIDADALMTEVLKGTIISDDLYGMGIMAGVDSFAKKLEAAPTLTLDDLRPKGRRIMKETMIRSPFAKNSYCSECNEETNFLHDFCPYCGADMRGGGEDG